MAAFFDRLLWYATPAATCADYAGFASALKHKEPGYDCHACLRSRWSLCLSGRGRTTCFFGHCRYQMPIGFDPCQIRVPCPHLACSCRSSLTQGAAFPPGAYRQILVCMRMNNN